MKKLPFMLAVALLVSCGATPSALESSSLIPDASSTEAAASTSSNPSSGESTPDLPASLPADSQEEENEIMKVTINGTPFELELADNSAAGAFKELLPLDLEMSSMAHEKYCYLEVSLPTSSYAPGRIEAGDVMLWGSDCLVFFYESFDTPYSYTRLGRLASTDGLLEACSSSSTRIVIERN